MESFELRCTVRGCSNLLAIEDRVLRCADGHCFDRAKGGYWNLTQPQDKKSLNPGDTDDAVLARHRWLEKGYGAGLVESINEWTSVEATPTSRVVDLGCGEGSFGKALFSNHADGFCGIDLSRKAIRLAAKSWPAATWVLANADRTLPIADHSLQMVVSLFGRRPVSEIGRVLADNGCCVVAIPAEEDLIELREQVQQSGVRRSRWEAVVDEMREANLTLVEHKAWTEQFELGREEIADALAMTYRAVRRSESARLEGVTEKQVTFAADLLLFRRE